MMQKWVVTAKRADFNRIAARFGIDPVVARLIRNRDVVEESEIEAYLYGSLEHLADPHLMKDVDKAVGILRDNIRSGKKIRVIGDYDIDGVCASAILIRGLKRVGADVDMKIPHRVTDGYGLNENLVREACADGRDTILTCDNGIAAAEQIALAKSFGLTVIITDHHEVPYELLSDGGKQWILPAGDAVINPRQADCPYPFKKLCGAVVAWKLILALYEAYGIPEEEGQEFLELCALATVGDVMDLTGENRILVKEGLKRMAHTQNAGLAALIQACNLNPEQISSYQIGFVLGPCINASGRLDTAERALRLLLTENKEEAAVIAGDLKALNDSRKELTRIGEEAAIQIVENSDFMYDRVLVVYLPEIHESLAGIIAGRLRECFHKPAFVLTRSADGIKGSGRSIETYSMYEELVRVRDTLKQFGGHPMAAGLSLENEEKIEVFRQALNGNCSLTADDLAERITIDVPMPISYLSMSLVRQLEILAPFGKGNEKPLFAEKNLMVSGLRVVGKNRNVVRMRVHSSSGSEIDAVYFGQADQFCEYARQHPVLMLSYYPEINVWNGRENLQITIKHYQ